MINTVINILLISLIFSGCSKRELKPVVVPPLKTKVETSKHRTSKENTDILKNQHKKRYTHCQKHEKNANHAYLYIMKEFNQAYFFKNDVQ